MLRRVRSSPTQSVISCLIVEPKKHPRLIGYLKRQGICLRKATNQQCFDFIRVQVAFKIDTSGRHIASYNFVL